ncbi:MAG: tyrosine-protein phosphatase, partial [Candidatus Methylumidiphilus sp.]
MIDLHCHLLPGLDDGPATMPEALAMARLAVANGIARAVVTPHIHPGRYDNTLDSISTAYWKFKAELAKQGIPLGLGMAAEVRIGYEIIQLASCGQLPFLGIMDRKNVLLVEFPHGHLPPGSEKLMNWLMDRGISPMIAHPERNKSVIRDLDKLRPFVEMGCYLQVTAGSVAGDFGGLAKKCAEQMLENGWVTLLASDAHNTKSRPPALEPG